MHIKNFEFKARVNSIEKYENKLLTLNPNYIGTDRQIDTYFNAQNGRLKLRQGNIENALIQYNRKNIKGSKESDIILFKHKADNALKDILTKELGVFVEVDKFRKIYFINNIKFHFDEVKNLGTFIEVEAIDDANKFSIDDLKNQCNYYFNFFELNEENIIAQSYSDLLLNISSINNYQL
ncbi:MAG: class IV adenylate cyclase [Bacteroidetes bacterium]|nr:class IV adenylate cyclase [Bacteroidota bacterium]MBS1592170.1 class IV adenylate cyclase [Bacteroidota bacterium]